MAMNDCSKCNDYKDMHAKCESCGAEICATCYEGFSTKCPKCGEERMELI